MSTESIGADSAPESRRAPFRLRDGVLQPVVAVLAGLVVAGVSWYRLGPVTRNTGWAEDVGRFLQEEIELGRVRSLWHPYEGYLHLVPRLLVDVAVTLQPIQRYAVTMAGLSCLFVGLVSAVVFLVSRDAVPQLWLRVVLALVPAFVPLAPYEISGNAANLHWYALLLAAWVFAARPRTWWGSALLAVLAGLVTGTEIQTAILLPLLLLGVRRLRTVPIAVVALLGVAAQVTSTLTHPRTHSGLPVAPLPDLGAGYLLQVVGGSWDKDVVAVSVTVQQHGWWVVILPAVLAVAVAVAAIVVGTWRQRWMVVGLGGASVAIWFAALVLNPNPVAFWLSLAPEQFVTIGPFRYAAAASMLLLSALVVAASALLLRRSTALRVVGLVVVAAVVVACAVNVVPSGTRRSAGPVWLDQVRAAEQHCAAAPADSVRIAAAPAPAVWGAAVPCALVNR